MALRLRPEVVLRQRAMHSVNVRLRPNQGLGQDVPWTGRKSSGSVKPIFNSADY